MEIDMQMFEIKTIRIRLPCVFILLACTVLFFYCCITDYHKVSSLKQHHLLSHNLWMSFFFGGGGYWLAESSSWGLTRVKSRCLPELWLPTEAPVPLLISLFMSRIYFLAPVWLSFLLSCKLPFLEAAFSSCHMATSRSSLTLLIFLLSRNG